MAPHPSAAGPGLYAMISLSMVERQSCQPGLGVPEGRGPGRGVRGDGYEAERCGGPIPPRGATAGRRLCRTCGGSGPSGPSPLPQGPTRLPEGPGRTCRSAGDTPTAARRADLHTSRGPRPPRTSASGLEVAGSGSDRGSSSRDQKSFRQ